MMNPKVTFQMMPQSLAREMQVDNREHWGNQQEASHHINYLELLAAF